MSYRMQGEERAALTQEYYRALLTLDELVCEMSNAGLHRNKATNALTPLLYSEVLLCEEELEGYS